MNIRYKILLLLSCCLSTVMLHGKVVKAITVSDSIPYTDHIALAKDATDKDIMVKFQFDEGKNTLTVSVISYRTLFVFWDDTHYKNAIHGRWIHTDQLPYIATSDAGQRFRLSKELYKSLPNPKKQYIFKKWISYEGIQPQEQEIKMVNSYIEQVFDIQNKRNNVTVNLNDIMLLDLIKQKGNKSTYQVSTGNNLDTEYQVTIQRNPCFGLDKEMDAAQKALDAVKKSYGNMKKKYGKGVVSSEEGKKAFDELKATLTAQFQHNNDSSACPIIQNSIEQYNLLADSLANMKVGIEVAATATEKVMGGKVNEANEKIVLTNARQLDSKVARWLISRDANERTDLIMECQDIIKDTKLIINTLSPSQSSTTIKIFRQAEQYFNKTCR